MIILCRIRYTLRENVILTLVCKRKATAPASLTALSEAQRIQALERFTIIRPTLEKEITQDDPVTPTLAYSASKLEAENELRNSGLNWSGLRLAFVYSDQDGQVNVTARICKASVAKFATYGREIPSCDIS